MVERVAEENRLLRAELAGLRQAILRADPTVLLDGRFERMIISPIAVISIARELVARSPAAGERDGRRAH